MLVMNQDGMNKLERSKFTLGADASVAAGPVGRTAAANTDAYMKAEILSWSRARGLFAGIALNGATLRPDKDANAELYGKPVETREVLAGNYPMPPAASPLITELDRAVAVRTLRPMPTARTLPVPPGRDATGKGHGAQHQPARPEPLTSVHAGACLLRL